MSLRTYFGAMLLVAMLLGSSGVTYTVPGVAQANAESDLSMPWQVSGQGLGAIKYNRATGQCYLLVSEEVGEYTWKPIKDPAVGDSHKKRRQILFIVVYNALGDTEVCESKIASDGSEQGVLLTKAFVDPGIGLKPGDLIQSVNGKSTKSFDALFEALDALLLEFGEEVKISIVRDGKSQTVTFNPNKVVGASEK